MDTTFQESAITPKLGEVRPVEIFSLKRREFDEETVTDLVGALARDGRFLQQIAVRDEGANGYRLIAGANRLEAWKRHFGKEALIPANIYPPHTSDALITMLEAEENLFRKELTAAERTAQEMRWVAAFKRLNGGNPVTPVSDTGRGGRKWESDSHFNAGARWPRQQGYGAAARREGRRRQARGEHEAEFSRGGHR